MVAGVGWGRGMWKWVKVVKEYKLSIIRGTSFGNIIYSMVTRFSSVQFSSPTRWTWVWVNSGSWWWTGRPGVLWFMGSQNVRHDWATELELELTCWIFLFLFILFRLLCFWWPFFMLEVCGSSLLWRFLPVGGVERVACQGFLVREACISVLVGGAGSLFSGAQWSVQ